MTYLIIPTHNRRPLLLNTLRQLRKQTYQNFKIVIVCTDGGRDLDCLSMVANEKAVVLHTKGYWSKSVNCGIDYLKTLPDVTKVCIMNDDNTFKSDFLENSLSKLSQNSILTCRAYDTKQFYPFPCGKFKKLEVKDLKLLLELLKFKTQTEGIIGINWRKFKIGIFVDSKYKTCSTRAMFIHYSDLLRMGKFSRLIPHYLSDIEFNYRSNKRKIKIIEGEEIETLKQDRNYPLFSIKNPSNPIFFTIFILIHCPLVWKLPNIIRVWGYTLIQIWRKRAN